MEIKLMTYPVFYEKSDNKIKENRNKKESIIAVLKKIAVECDEELAIPDANWKVTNIENYHTNIDYMCDYVRTYNNNTDIIEDFFSLWMLNDEFYQTGKYNWTVDKEGNISSISFAYLSF